MLNLAHYEEMERQVMAIFREVLFDPIVDVIKEQHPSFPAKALANAAKDDLADALRKGEIQYVDGVFTGKFTGRTSKALRDLGAKFDQRSKVYRLPVGMVPADVKALSVNFALKAKATNQAILRTLDDVQGNLDTILARSKVKSKGLVDRVTKDFHDVARKMEIPVDLSEGAKDRMADAYTNNMELWIKKWCEEEIQELRGVVEENALEGYRYSNLSAVIQNRYSVSQSKAKFLARQETAMFVSKYRKERFTDAGVKRYKWSTSHDERVRPAPWVKGKARLDNHRILDGKIFFYNDPPVVDMASGRRANPGEDYNCRCVDIPILDPVEVGT